MQSPTLGGDVGNAVGNEGNVGKEGNVGIPERSVVGWVEGNRVSCVEVGLGVSVGGSGVSVGLAICVAATIVHAAATAVFCVSTDDIVGVVCAPQAVKNTARSSRMGKTRLNIIVSIFFIILLSSRLSLVSKKYL
jgi:hypothetical protein